MRINIYATVEEHDREGRERLLQELNNLDVMPVFHGDKIEFRYYGERETVNELREIAEGYMFHSIHVWAGK